MAGGVGFSKLGHDSFNDNRRLRNNRLLMKDNPYKGFLTSGDSPAASAAQELKDWRMQKLQRERRLRLLLLAVLLPALILIAVLCVFLL